MHGATIKIINLYRHMQPYEDGRELQLARDSFQWRRFMLAVFTVKSFESSPVNCGMSPSVRT
jgi:hypothetical protein